MFNTDDILGQLKLTGPYPQEEYVDKALSLGKDAEKFMDAIDTAVELGFTADRWKKIYKLKNKNKKLSLLSSAHSYGANYRSMLDWIGCNVDEKPSNCIELGCENGLFTQCLQLVYPEAFVAGLDALKEPIMMAKQLAYDNKLTRIDFYQKNLTKPFSLDVKFDVIFAPFIFHELMELDEKQWQVIVANIEGMAANSAKLIAFNRFPYPEVSEQFIRHFSGSRFKLKDTSSIEAEEKIFPVHVFEMSV